MPKDYSLSEFSKHLQTPLISKFEILKTLKSGLTHLFDNASVSIALMDPRNFAISQIFPETDAWPFPEKEKQWIISRSHELLLQPSTTPFDFYYLQNRGQQFYVDKPQLSKDQAEFDYSCDDGLYYVLVSEHDLILGLIFIHSWQKKTPLNRISDFQDRLQKGREFVTEAVISLDHYFTQQKIEALVSDKQKLKEQLGKDEDLLNQRILELTVLYETSNSLGYSLNHHQIVSLIMDALYRVLNFDLCTILVMDFIPENELFTRVNKPISSRYLAALPANVVATISPFTSQPVSAALLKEYQEKYFAQSQSSEKTIIRSFAHVPLIFKEDVIGMLMVGNSNPDSFKRNEMTFLHTMTNQLSSHLGRLKIVRRLEKSKISSLINSMTDGVVMLDKNHQLDLINPAAKQFLDIKGEDPLSNEIFQKWFSQSKLSKIYSSWNPETGPLPHQDLNLGSKSLSVGINTVANADQENVGNVITIRDITELQKMHRVKTQRLEIISKVNLIIKSITDLDNLLTVMMEFILTISAAEMGSIQLRKGKAFLTKVHSNFPDKIRRDYKFKNGETISEFVARTKNICIVDHYMDNLEVDSNVKIFIETYICIPILIKHNLIGLINIVQKSDRTHLPITSDDIETLSTITALAGTAIHNALLYKETIKKQRLDQELKVAYEIQSKLLPSTLPDLDRMTFGAISIPAREIGGDYYDVIKLDTGEYVFIMADIIGKGIPAGLFMAMLKSIVTIQAKQFKSPKETLEKLNNILFHDSVINRFVPLFYGVLNPKTKVFRYANAGHEPALWWNGNTFRYLDSNGFPLGALEDVQYEEKSIQLENHHILVLFTDGIVDARNEDKVTFGHQKLESVIRDYQQMDAQGIVEAIYTEVQKYFRAGEQNDDLTLLALRVDEDYKSHIKSKTALFSKEIKIDSAKKHIKFIRKEISDFASQMDFSEKDIYNIKLAVNEAHANVIEHAYFGSESGDIIFRFIAYPDRLEISIKDFGPGISQKSIKGEDHLDELEGSGLGVFLINSVMDRVQYKHTARNGTELVLTKFVRGQKNGN